MSIEVGKCLICQRIMHLQKGAGCAVNTVMCNEKEYKRIPAYEDCNECGAKAGSIHHYGCDQEVCPSCGSQLLSCNCEGVRFVTSIEKSNAKRHPLWCEKEDLRCSCVTCEENRAKHADGKCSGCDECGSDNARSCLRINRVK